MTKDEALKLALEALQSAKMNHGKMLLSDPPQEAWRFHRVDETISNSITAIKEALAQPEQEPVTVLPDGSAFAVMSYPLPKDHWLYADRQYENGADEPNELGKPILTHALCDAVVSAVRYAIRGATNCGKELDFDPDALVQNAVYALCGPYTTPPQRTWVGLTDEEVSKLIDNEIGFNSCCGWEEEYTRAVEAKLKEKNT